MSVTVTYIGACPTCGSDAEWTTRADNDAESMRQRLLVDDIEIECEVCGDDSESALADALDGARHRVRGTPVRWNFALRWLRGFGLPAGAA